MKKICFVMTDAVSFNILCKDQLEYFSSKPGIELTLICGGNKEQIDYLKSRNIGRVVEMPLLRRPNVLVDIKCLFILLFFFICNRFDLVVYSTPKALLLGSLATFFSFQPKRVAIVQGRVYENFRGLKKITFQFLDKLSFFLANKVIFVSKSLMKKTIHEKLVSNNKSLVIGSGSFNGVNVARFNSCKDSNCMNLKKKLNIFEDSFVVCIVGRICKDKGIEDLEKVISFYKFDNIKFIIVGSIEDKFSERILDKIKKNKNVTYMKHTNDVENIFKICDLHLFLTHREGFGNVAIEAASCNLPTFAFNVVGVQDSVKNNISGLRFNFKDSNALIDAIQIAKKNPKQFKNNFSKSREWVIANFEQKTVWQGYLQFYLDIIEDKINHN